MVGFELGPELDFGLEIYPRDFGFKLGTVLGIQLRSGTCFGTQLGPEGQRVRKIGFILGVEFGFAPGLMVPVPTLANGTARGTTSLVNWTLGPSNM